ncbi:MAG TPA: hypothetical protein VGK86_02020 [Thermoanaerobaculia bacterium]|jgi:hypothetical protein
MAERILDRYRRSTASKPLPLSYVIRMKLRSAQGSAGATGVHEIAWEPNRYRERVSSAGFTTERGIQGGKAYATDEDGVTRVVSEPVLRELLTRSYFWRRAWLFQDRERARLSIGPADATAVSLRLTPLGGNPLLLSFSRRDGSLLAVRSPRFDLDFTGPRSFREAVGARPAVLGEIVWSGLPTEQISDAAVGGACARFGAVAAQVPFERTPGGGVAFPARINGVELRLALDVSVDGPLAVSPAAAGKLGLSFARDVYGRSIGAGAKLEIGSFSCGGIHVEALPAAPDGSDGVVGGTVFREAVVELDPEGGRLTLFDPASWVIPEGFTRVLVDDDGDRPVTTMHRRSDRVRLAVGTAARSSDLLLAPEAASRLDVAGAGVARGLRWGTLELPDLSVGRDTSSLPAWGEDGRIGFALLLRFHSHLDMPHRWIYLRPVRR